ncbi:MAG: hypothetical protein HZR80_10530 [Candidatus Heimdallarchaeota archaeon]
MKVTEPKCPECGENEFAWKFIPSAAKLKRRSKFKKIRFNILPPFAVGFCVNCGHII